MSYPNSIYFDIHVTQAVIDRGCQRSSDNCPIAIAIIEGLRTKGYQVHDVEVEGPGFLVTLDHTYCHPYSHHTRGQTFQNTEITKFIERFDSGELVLPFSLLNVRIDFDNSEYDEYED